MRPKHIGERDRFLKSNHFKLLDEAKHLGESDRFLKSNHSKLLDEANTPWGARPLFEVESLIFSP